MDKEINTAFYFAKLLDTQFTFLGYKFGMDPIIGLIPILGHILPVVVCIYMVVIGKRMGLPNSKVIQMIMNSLIDYFAGEIPAIGSLIDATFKSNTRNYNILKLHYYSITLRTNIN